MKRMECLDGLRGVLAVYVMLGHMAPFAAMPRWIAHPLSHGGAAVDVFFILSGLVILRSLESVGFQARPFLLARIARIYPLYLPLLALAIAVQPLPIDYTRLPWIPPQSPAHDIWSSGWPANAGTRIAAHLVMAHGLPPDALLPGCWVSFLGSAWSLSTEWQFYLLILLAGRRLGAAGLARLFLAIAVAGIAWDTAAPEAWRFSRAFLPNKAHLFALGIASAALARGGPAGRYVSVLGAAILLCLVQGGATKALPALCWTLCLAAQLHPEHPALSPLARTLRHPALQRLGLLSYAIYLANEPLQKLFGVALAQAAGGSAALFTATWLPGATLLPVLAASWLHRWIEQPALRAGRAWIGSMRLAGQRRTLARMPLPGG